MTYDLTPQEKEDYCLCSVLQAILRKYEIDESQDEIAQQLTLDKNGFKVDDEKIDSLLTKHNLDYSFYWLNETPFNEPDIVLQEMSQYSGFLGIDTHVYLVENYQDPSVTLIDPKHGNLLKKDYYDLLREMFPNGFFAVVKKE